VKVLFVCTLNAVRSPMAQVLAKQLYPEHEFFSAGLVEGPEDYFAIEVMNEIGVDISKHKSKTLDAYKGKKFDLVVFMAEEARQKAAEYVELLGGVKTLYWPIPSPADTHGSRIMKLFGYREIRDKIRKHLRDLKL